MSHPHGSFRRTRFGRLLAIIGGLANKEKERRQEITNNKVITNEEVAKYRSESLTNPQGQPSTKPDSEKKIQNPPQHPNPKNLILMSP